MTDIDAERIIWSKAQEEYEVSGGVWCNLTFDEQLELYCKQRDIEQKEPCVWVVLKHTDQSNYSEGRYYSCAEDATEVIGIYDNEDAAQEIATKLEKEEAEYQSLNDYDEDADGIRYFTVKSMPIQHEPRWLEILVGLDCDVRDDR